VNVHGMVNDGLNAPFTGPLLSDMTATANGAGEGQHHLSAKDIQDMESILRTGMVGYAYVYPLGGEPPQTYVFSMTPENMGNFIGKHGHNCHKIVMTDRVDMLILDTYCGLIDKCRDKQLLHEVLQHLMPIQFRHAEPKEVVCVSQDVYDLYDTLLEAAHTDMKKEVYPGEQQMADTRRQERADEMLLQV